MKTKGNVFGGVLLVAGTCIGAGMLGLPVVTAASGFFPTLCAFTIVWFFSNCSALAYLEVSLRFKGEINLISMVERTLGPLAKWIAWICFILLLYSLMAAYTAGGSSMLAKSLDLNIHDKSMGLTIALSFALPFALLVYFGAYWVDHLNRLLVLGLVITFAAMCIFTLHIGPANQFHAVGESKFLLFTFPILITAFGYHLLIPTLKTYLQENVNQLRKVIIIGTLLPLIVYTIWEVLVLTLIPTWGDNGLVQMLHDKQDSTSAMIRSLDSHGNIIQFFVTWFCFFALTSSFLGVGLAISDFFRDALHIHRTHKGRMLSSLLTFGPPVLYTIFYPQGFLLALRYAGMFAAILLIIYPVMMAWNARYVSKFPGKYQMFGGKLILAITLLFGLLVVCADILHHLGYLPIPHN